MSLQYITCCIYTVQYHYFVEITVMKINRIGFRQTEADTNQRTSDNNEEMVFKLSRRNQTLTSS